jgi:hypothetical protein
LSRGYDDFLFALIVAASLLARQDQTPRPLVKNERGLLQINRQYFDLAANTGGDYYFWAPGEFGTKLQVPLPGVPVLLSYGSMESKKVFEIPIESGVTQFMLFAGVQRKDLAVLVRPNGTPLHDVQVFQHMLIATVLSPAAGVWRLELDGEGTYAVTAHLKPADDGPHFHFDSSECRAVLTNARDGQLSFVALDGSEIASAPLDHCTVPKVPFRAMVRGVDATGAAFQRIESHPHTPN